MLINQATKIENTLVAPPHPNIQAYLPTLICRIVSGTAQLVRHGEIPMLCIIHLENALVNTGKKISRSNKMSWSLSRIIHKKVAK